MTVFVEYGKLKYVEYKLCVKYRQRTLSGQDKSDIVRNYEDCSM